MKGRTFGASGTKVAEVVFNTSLSGYQEIMTDPSYRDQMVCFTYPHIGNVGINVGATVTEIGLLLLNSVA
jgi:carbamoyl-phosphate synthase small subunit